MKSIEGFTCLLIGIGIIIYNIKDREKDKDDTYGGRTKLYGGAAILIVLGIVLIIRDLQ